MQLVFGLIRKYWKVVLALSFPIFVTWVFFYSKEMAEKESEKLAAEQALHPTTKNPVIENYEMKEVDGQNRIRWQLKAAKGTALGDMNQEVALNGVQMTYVDPDTQLPKLVLIAPEGSANAATKYVKLTSAGGKKVEAKGSDGKLDFVTQTLELEKDNKFKATGGVNINWPEVAKVTGDSATGVIDLPDFKNFKIVGRTHAQIVVK